MTKENKRKQGTERISLECCNIGFKNTKQVGKHLRLKISHKRTAWGLEY